LQSFFELFFDFETFIILKLVLELEVADAEGFA
jgi:hypothetical protein